MQAYAAHWCRCAEAAKQCCDEMRYLAGAGRGHYSTGGKWVRAGGRLLRQCSPPNGCSNRSTAHAAAGLGLLLPPPVAIMCAGLGRLAMVRSRCRLDTRLKKCDSSALVVACGGAGRAGQRPQVGTKSATAPEATARGQPADQPPCHPGLCSGTKHCLQLHPQPTWTLNTSNASTGFQLVELVARNGLTVALVSVLASSTPMVALRPSMVSPAPSTLMVAPCGAGGREGGEG